MKSGTLRANIPRGKFILPRANFVSIYVLRILLEKKGKSGRLDRKDRVIRSSSAKLKIAGIVRIRHDTQESELFRETIARHFPSSGFSRLLRPNLDYFDG